MIQPRAHRASQCGTVAGRGHILRGGRAEPRKWAASFAAQGAVFAASSVQLGDKLMLARRALLAAVAQLPLAGVAMARASTESETVIAQSPGSDEVGEQLRALGPQRVMEAAGEEPEGIGMEPKGPRSVVDKQYLVVLRHGQRIDEVDKSWSAKAARPYDPYLTELGEQQARAVAADLKQFDLKRVYVSPFLRCLQTNMLCQEGLGIPPEKWTIDCGVCEFLAPFIMVKKGGTLPVGNINSWFFEKGDLKSSLPGRLPPDIAARVNIGQSVFSRFPENLMNSRRRYIKAFQEFTEAADGENVLVVSHMDAVNASVSRYMPWALVYPVKHTGFTVSYREKYEDGGWGPWHLDQKSGENGVNWNERLWPIWAGYKGVSAGVSAVSSLFSRKS